MKQLSNYYFLVFLVLCLLIITACQKDKSKEAQRPIVLANINGDIITAAEFQQKFDTIKANYDPVSLQLNKESLKKLKKSLLNQMITQIVLLQEAKLSDIKVSEEELTTHIDNHRSQFTKEQFRLMLIKKNINFSTWKGEQKKFLLAKKVTEKIAANAVPPKDDELKSYYQSNIDKYQKKEQARIKQIVVHTNTLATSILKQIKKGANFEELAKEYSLSPDAAQGGDIGWFEKGRKIPEFDIAFKLAVGKISKVIKSAYGYHIIKVVSKKPSNKLAFKDVKNQIYDYLLKIKQDAYFNDWLEKRISSIDISQNNKVLDMIH